MLWDGVRHCWGGWYNVGAGVEHCGWVGDAVGSCETWWCVVC